MKKIQLYISVLAVIVLSACSESFLDSVPTTSLTDENYYKTISDAETALVGCYDGLQKSTSAADIAFPVLSEVLSDDCFGGTGKTDGLGYQLVDEFDLSRSPADVDVLHENWINYYRAIFRCNVLLQKMDQIDWEGDTEKRNSIEAQTRFLRAHFYFDMVRTWEKVPLLTEPSRENLPQAEPAETYQLIAEDLLFAAENGSAEVSPGRINKWTAKAYLARVFLFYTGYYGTADLVGIVSKAQVLQGLEDLIGSGNYGLVEEYKNLWPAAVASVNEAGTGLTTTYAGNDNMETVFAIKYNITSDYNGNTDGNHWLVMMGLRSQSFSPYGRGWGACTVLPSFYSSYEEGDLRRDATIIGIDEEGLDFDNGDQREYTGYSNKKYTPLSNPDGTDVPVANGGSSHQINQYQDYVVMRYADVLLMAAELGSTNAQTYFDEVRTRAGLESKPVTMGNIMDERHFEFALEGVRYWDLLRQGLETAANELDLTTTVLNGGVEVQKNIKKENVIKTRGFQIIPQTEINLSDGVLVQNEGWK